MNDANDSRRMPHEEPLEVGDLEMDAATLVDLLGPRLTERRRETIDEVLDHRTYHVTTVLDGIYDRGNVSAVIRSAEAFGFQSMHVVESQEHFKEANRVTQGTDKWIDVERYARPEDCIPVLRDRGYRIVTTELEAERPIGSIDFDTPTAMVFGNEKDGVSETMREAADASCILPMVGFAQSLNISVCAALSLREIFERRRKRGGHGDLSNHEATVLRALYYVRSIDQPERLLRGLLSRRGGEREQT